jgi:hypothetical protein
MRVESMNYENKIDPRSVGTKNMEILNKNTVDIYEFDDDSCI